MSIHELGVKIPLRIKTLTPLHIGGNDVLSPFADYWMDDQKNINLVDSGKLAKAVYETGNTAKYVKEVEAVVDMQKKETLADFVRQSLKRDIKDMLTDVSYKSYAVHNPVNIDCCIETDGQAYIPGSSLKGAIRTTILQNWLNITSPESDKALTDFMKAISAFSKRNDLRKNQQAAEIEKAFREGAEEKLFGNLKQDNRLAASCLRVNDSNTAPNNTVSVYQLQRFSLATGNGDIPVLKQCIDRNTTLDTTVYIDYYMCHQKTHHPIFRDIAGKHEFFALLNNVSLELVKYELSIFKSPDIDAGKIKAFENFLMDMKDKIESAGTSKAYMRMGFGKMQFYQTIAIPLFKKTGMNEESNDWIEYLSYCDGLSGDIPAIYPATRMLTSTGQLPLGWLEME